MKNAAHLVTFYYGTTGSQQVKWNEHDLPNKMSIGALAKDWKNDLGADGVKIERIV